MQPRTILITIFWLTTSCPASYGQQVYTSRVDVKQMTDTFGFAKQWDYPWYTLKDEDGKFSSALNDTIHPEDTAHLYHTANCETNVQGGYEIRYCFATRTSDVIMITFSDGLPAYAGTYSIYIRNDSFYFKPDIIYPKPTRKISYHTDRQKLILNQHSYNLNDLIIGYADIEFSEIPASGKAPSENKIYLRGYFRVRLWVGMEQN